MIKVGVIFGGESVEHEVSIISAIQAMNKMDAEKYEIIPIYIDKNGEWYTGEFLKEIETFQDMDLLKKYAKNVVLYRNKYGSFVLQSKGFLKKAIKEIDIAFPIVHGTNVEDGALQGYLKTIGIPFMGPDVAPAAIGQDKVFQKQIWDQEGLPIPEYTWFFDSEYEDNPEKIIKQVEKIKYPVIVKPATLGSSVGIGIANNKEELKEAIEEAIKYDNKILVEEVIKNLIEVNISVVGNTDGYDTSVIERVLSANEILTYEDKYVGGKKGRASKGMASATRKIPADISEKLTNDVRDVAVKASRALNLSGDVRIDFLIDDKKKKIYLNEVNTIPGSLAFYLWEPAGKSYTELLDELINIGIKDFKKKNGKVNSFESNILSGYSGVKGAKGAKGVKTLK